MEIFTARLAEGLMASGHKVAIVTGGEDESEADVLPGVVVASFRFLDALRPGTANAGERLRLTGEIASAIAAFKMSFRPDIVHVNFCDAIPFFHLRSLDAHPAATVVTFQTALEQPVSGTKGVVGALIHHAGSLVAVSQAAAANIARFTTVPQDRIEIIHPGIPARHFTGPNSREPAIGPPVIGFLGRLVEEKGVQIALRALARIGNQARLLVIGDGVFRADLEALAGALDVAHLVIFTGLVDDAERRRLLRQCRALVVPSLHEELFGMVAAEGALAGLPVIASAVGGLREIVSPGETGFLFHAGDVAALESHMRSLIEDAALAHRMGLAGRERALARYTIETTVARYEAVYTGCITASQAGQRIVADA